MEFFGQMLSGHVDGVTFWAWLHATKWRDRLAVSLSHAACFARPAFGAIHRVLRAYPANERMEWILRTQAK